MYRFFKNKSVTAFVLLLSFAVLLISLFAVFYAPSVTKFLIAFSCVVLTLILIALRLKNIAVLNEKFIPQLEKMHREAEERYKALFDLCPDAIALCRDGQIIDANKSCLQLFGVDSRDELMGKDIDQYLFNDTDNNSRSVFHARNLDYSYQTRVKEMKVKHGNGNATDIEVRESEIEINKKDSVLVLMHDISERKKAEREIQQLNNNLEIRVAERTAEAEERANQLQKLAGELTKAEESVRRRIGQYLHDHLQQLLAAGKFGFGSIKNIGKDLPEDSVEQVDRVFEEAIQATRSLSYELCPPILYERGLPPALNWLARHMKETHGLPVKIERLDNIELSEEVSVFLFQATRELLFNVTKHAQADTAALNLELDNDGSLNLQVIDDGIGIDGESNPLSVHSSEGGMGLFRIKERIDLLGGKIDIENGAENGAVFTLVLRHPQLV